MGERVLKPTYATCLVHMLAIDEICLF